MVKFICYMNFTSIKTHTHTAGQIAKSEPPLIMSITYVFLLSTPVPAPAPKHNPHWMTVLVHNREETICALSATMVKLYQAFADNEKAKYPRTQHIPCKWGSAKGTCFSVAFVPAEVILRDNYAEWFLRSPNQSLIKNLTQNGSPPPLNRPLGDLISCTGPGCSQKENPQNVASASGRPEHRNIQRVGLRRVYKEREAGPTDSHLVSGMQDDKQSVLSSGLFPPRKAEIQKIGARGFTHYEFAHILKTVIFYLFLAPYCQMFAGSTSSL